jgi:glycosyltransferase involved in cell wall biosynthesis
MMSQRTSVTLLNTSFRPQRVTGQQRYATEVASRLLEFDGFSEVTPGGWFSRSALRTWSWVFTVLEARARGHLLVSMTARAPWLHRRQVQVVHDLFVLTHPEWFSRKYVMTHAALLRAQLKRAVAVVAVSQPVADEVRSMFFGPIVVAPNAPSEVFFDATSLNSDALSSRGLRADGYLIAVGSMDPRKNLVVLAEAYASLSAQERMRFPLVIVGGGAAIYRESTIEWPLETVRAGYISDIELRDLYAGARAVIFPSLAEGFGLPLVEAAAAGTRALAVSDIPVFRWVCGDGATYFDPGSVSDVASALRRVATDPVPVSIDLTRFNWDSSATVIAKLCQSLINSAGSAHEGNPMPGSRLLSVAVGLASAGRPQLLDTVTRNLDEQHSLDGRPLEFNAIVSVPDEKSLPAELPDRWRLVTGSRGLAAQRNAALEHIGDSDIVFFFDDDAVIRSDYVARGLEFFARHPEVAGITGRVLLDGATHGEISEEDAATALASTDGEAPSGRWEETRVLYGCNFAFRVSAAPGIGFDARLPLYSWLEDHDFARRLKRSGKLARVDDCVIVHRGSSSGGRQAHRRLGYSQMMNPIYLWRKGSFPLWLAAWEIFRPTAKNIVRSMGGNETSWRRERLRANGMALFDAVRGRITPERILDL